MEKQKIVNLLNSSENKYSKFATKKWYIIDSETKGSYSHHDSIKFLTKSIESSLCDYSDPYILVTGDIGVTRTIAAACDNPFQRNNHLLEPDKQHLKIVHYLKTVKRKSMIHLLIMQILLILQCLCAI